MKIAVYAIAKNEEDNVEGWYESAKDADELILLDTGSDDDTHDMSRRLGIKTYRTEVVPWRFDDARNTALQYIDPDVDFCIALDLDERLQPGWREAFDKVNPSTTRIKYRMTYIDDSGTERMWYWANRCHHRQGYRWEYAIHEKPVKYDGEEVVQLLDFDTHHIPDKNKERNYVEMLKEYTERYPDDDRYVLYYARELLANGKPIKAYEEFQRFLHMGKATQVQYADVYRYMAYCQIAPVQDLKKSLAFYSKRRECYIDLARYYSDRNMWRECLENCDKAFAITEHPTEYTSFAYAWGDLTYSMASLAAMNMGDFERAKEYVKQGLEQGDSERLKNNLRLIEINQSLSLMV